MLSCESLQIVKEFIGIEALPQVLNPQRPATVDERGEQDMIDIAVRPWRTPASIQSMGA